MDTAALLRDVGDLHARGMFLSAHDLAMTGIDAGAGGDKLRHLAVLSLARAGATSSALSLSQRFGLHRSDDRDIAGLLPRLMKDVALDSRNTADAVAAGRAYAELWQRDQSGWYGINAAAMALLAGNRAEAHSFAAAVRALPDTGDYWSAATQAEAALLEGDAAAAAIWLTQAEARAGNDLSCRASTRLQLDWEAELLGADRGLASLLSIPETLHYCGLIPGSDGDEAALRASLTPLLRPVGFAYGGLAAGADIVVAEMLLDQGAAVTAILPFPPEVYLEQSVRPGGDSWIPRFRACLARATVQVLETGHSDDLDYALGSERSMGLARLHAARLGSRCWQLAIWDRGAVPGLAGTAADVRRWREAGGETTVLDSPWPRQRGAGNAGPTPNPTRQAKAVLFGDLPRFSELDDAGLLAFYSGPLVAMGRVVDAARPLYRNAWGDAVQLVFETADAAADCAFNLRAAATEGRGLPASMMPRLAMDFGGLHAVFDAVQRADKFAGRTMTRAARIEPITPPGSIYATEAFACAAALLVGNPIACDYAGRVPLAKSYGTLPLYAVHPAPGRVSGAKRGHNQSVF